MNDTPFPINRKFPYPKINAYTFPQGGRLYNTPNGEWVPSVTTILSIMPKEGIDNWRARIGDEEADRQMAEACRIGTTMHDRLEGYVSNFLQGRPDIPPESDEDKLAYFLADNMKRYALIELDEVWGIEEGLCVDGLYAGRTDLIGVWKGKSSIMDYKSSKMLKKPEWLEGYKMQIAAYNFCHKSMFGVGMQQGVIMIAIRPPIYRDPIQIVTLNKLQLDEYEDKWLRLVEEYTEGVETGKIRPVGTK